MESRPPDLNDDSSVVVPLQADDSVSEMIIDAVSSVTDQPLTHTDRVALDEVESLYDSVDPDALDRLFADPATEAQLTFYFADCEVEFVNGSHVMVSKRD